MEKNEVDAFFRKPQTHYAARLLDLHRGLYTGGVIRIMINMTEAYPMNLIEMRRCGKATVRAISGNRTSVDVLRGGGS